METQRLHSPARAAKFFCLAVLLMAASLLPGQSNPLNRPIKLRVQEKQLGEALVLMGQAGEFSFAYNAEQMPEDSLVSLEARGETVRQVLDALFEGKVTYKPIGNHIVLRLQATKDKEDPEWIDVRGFLIDGVTGEPLRYATVYEGGKHGSTLTAVDGSFKLRVPGRVPTVPLSFSKAAYRDTVVVIRPLYTQKVTVGLLPRPQFEVSPIAVSLAGDSDDRLPLADLFVPEEQQQRAFNLRASLASFPIQISLLPSIGTNGLMSGGMTNHFSLNVLAGYSNGVAGLEIGGLVNINREQMLGMQVGGLANIVGGNTAGFQVAGLANHVRGSAMGFQAGGLYNVVREEVYGIQVGGLANIAGRDVYGLQVAGLVNRAKGNVRMMQIGGLVNRADDVGGFQIAGLANQAQGDVGGFQIAGLANNADGRVAGFQIAGVFNRAERVQGIQIGLINVADTLEGVAIGLVNISQNGYKAVSLSSTEVNDAQLSIRSGREYFYSILSLGARLRSGRHQAWSYGGGLGTSLGITPSLRLELELWIEQVNEDGLGPGRLNLVQSLRPGITLRPTSWLELNGGAAISLGVANAINANGEFISDVPRNPFYSESFGPTQLSAWLGYQGGLRILF